MTFQRARSEEQREIRRRTILDTAAAMLDEMPVAEVSLNELSRRVGLAKSNVLRYFESREAVLLELLDDFLGRWLADLADELAAGIEAHAAPEVRAGQLAVVLSRSLADRVVLCDLFGAQGGVLEHNVSVEVVKRHKRSSLTRLAAMTELVRRHVPELGDDAQLFCLMSLVSAGALSSYVPPPPSLLAAYADEPALGALHMELPDALRAAFTSALLGVLPRA
ncbi:MULTISPECIES: TetR family transcriptional regulator [unclassified Streptomyces]|uniref:TetR/AcrR family transcriptional regulator n=1 Tax=Streptomyces TaxID=1883 RepID=UPI0001C19310|nr:MULTISPECIES: TetR family transcriptional regulator [unclassified Streptomyces]MYR70203.1 TetR family transcriptional regulator [Streptomyces sp. SID4939]MYS03659.1 TetR family transcriptional regulator [Streptomyces sp. SID4940]MYT64587.1 TetR family transcriptional regulator [Streptomyces sp. SID8357]MYT87400.1 TetR family transcriptional regulator [Streptomyces sp. SID8360]MYU34852.1 TetR family transcriptional regulator [Streptomyces sp. SID8358]MYW37037.1 TetR family transcriptional r